MQAQSYLDRPTRDSDEDTRSARTHSAPKWTPPPSAVTRSGVTMIRLAAPSSWLEEFEQHAFPEDVKRKILLTNAQRLFDLE